jgi:cephalosporin hydroxylase
MTDKGKDYLEEWYAGKVWKNTYYRGIRTLKFPIDMWNYQEIIFDRDIRWVVETGTRHGGSAVFFADLLEKKGKKGGGVISIDTIDEHLHALFKSHKRCHFILGDSASKETLDQVFELLPPDRGQTLFIFDSDHSAFHVKRELEAYVPRMQDGDYLIVEDTIIDGPRTAVKQYLALNTGTLIRDIGREMKQGCTVAPGGYYIKQCDL